MAIKSIMEENEWPAGEGATDVRLDAETSDRLVVTAENEIGANAPISSFAPARGSKSQRDGSGGIYARRRPR